MAEEATAERRKTVIERLLYERVLKDQEKYLSLVPEEKRKQGYGRAAMVIIDGENGGTFLLWFTDTGVGPKPDDVPVKNKVWMAEDTFWACVTPDLSKLERRDGTGRVVATGLQVLADSLEKDGLAYVKKYIVPQLAPRLDFRYALSKQLITVDGEASAYDSEEWAQAIEKLIVGKIFPLVVEGLTEKKK